MDRAQRSPGRGRRRCRRLETSVFLGNGARCPLTGAAEALGAGHGSVTDLFLPRWLARNLPAIHVPLLFLAAYLHARNLRSLRGA